MADLNALYSKNGEEPTFLPHEIFLKSTGMSRTDPSSFTDEELIDAGFTGPYVKPEYDVENQVLEWNSSTLTWDIKWILKNETTYLDNTILDSPPSPEDEFMVLMGGIRMQRTFKLQYTDWTLNVDSPLSEEQKAECKDYRQKLRDVPQNINTLEEAKNLVWPELPSFLQ